MFRFLRIFRFLILGSLASCYEVTEGDLFENFESQIIIEAKITNRPPPYYIQVSRTVHPKDSVAISLVRDARVIVSDSKGNFELLEMIQPGLYVVDSIVGESNVEYNLLVNINEENFRAIEVMKNAPEVHRIEVLYLEEFVQQEGYFIRLYIDKKANETSYYRLEVSKNGTIFNDYSDLIVFNDAFVTDVVEYLVPYTFELGDTVNINLHRISETMDKYYYELTKQTNNAFSDIQPPMQNPPSNYSNNALGYFEVSAVASLEVIIQ
ncbi:MAG: DUF4249 family protein [Salinivirgaceae bacterium]|jgi:hypothetical protein|nr:DUF4249 family protein [Salinivirgaceae bacterium]